jgi:hypothetical protein
MQAANPYYRRSAISSPREFFGRENEIEEIYQLIRQQQSIFLLGERRTGKSSILNAISFLRDDRVPEEVRFVFVNCLYAAGSPERRFIKHMLNQITDEAEIDSFPPERDSLVEAAKQARRKGRQLAILMDEFDVLLDNPEIPRDLFGFFRAWSEEYAIPFVITSREGRIDALLKTESVGSPFWNIFKTVYVGPFSHSEALQLIETPAERCELPFKPEEVDWIHDRGGHHPLFLQIAASYAFNQRDIDPERKQVAFIGEADQHFEYILDFMPERERIALAAFQRGEQLDQRTKSELLRKGMLIDENDKLRIFSTALSDKLLAPRRQSADTVSGNIVDNLSKFVRG